VATEERSIPLEIRNSKALVAEVNHLLSFLLRVPDNSVQREEATSIQCLSLHSFENLYSEWLL